MGFELEASVPAITVFLQGLLSFFSPCVLPLVPLYLGYLSGGIQGESDFSKHRGKLLLNTVCFVLGISAAFFLMGAGVSAAGSFLHKYQMVFAKAGGILIVLFGFYQLGVFGKSKVLGNEHRLPIHLEKLTMSPFTALLFGFTFSFAWTPCVGPALASVLVMAGSAQTQAAGFIYGWFCTAVSCCRIVYGKSAGLFQKTWKCGALYGEGRRCLDDLDGTDDVHRENECGDGISFRGKNTAGGL